MKPEPHDYLAGEAVNIGMVDDGGLGTGIIWIAYNQPLTQKKQLAE